MSARHEAEGLKYGLAETAKATETLEFSVSDLGQRNPQHCPPPAEVIQAANSSGSLGDPMDIGQVAALLGCSAWTVRQRYLRQGLPHLRTCASGKLIFFREQVIGWILRRQQQRQKGGQLR
jgi:hypothetical protein